MKYQQIIDSFTCIVKKYLEVGFTFDPEMMGGTQGEVISVGLKRGDEGLAFSIFEQDAPAKGHPYRGFENSLVFYAEAFSVSDWKAKEATFWFSRERDYKTITKVVYYNVARPGADGRWFTVCESEALEIRNKQVDRAAARFKSGKRNKNKKFESEGAKELALKIAKRTPGFKRAKPEDVKSFYKSLNGYSKVAYFIEFNVNSKFGCKKLALDKNLQKVAC